LAKQYISLIRLFDHCGIPADDNINLPRIKKQLQAEFGITGGGFIEVDDYSYNRHDVFEEIERPDFLQRLVFHKQIWKRPQILQLLENNIADFSGTLRSEFALLWNNKAFDEFFSPYFAGPFNYLSRTLLADTCLREMGDLLAYENFLLPAEREEAYRPVRVFLDENLKILRNVNRENYKIMRPKIVHWIGKEWHQFFNNLPHEFYDIKFDIINYLVNIGVAIQKSHRRDCRQMSEQLILLQDAPERLMEIIASNHNVYTRSSGSTWSFGWGRGFGVAWLIFMLFRVVASDGCGDNKTPYKEFITPQYPIRDSSFKIVKDSIFEIHHDTLSRPKYKKKY
jgi:hypothetical protein